MSSTKQEGNRWPKPTSRSIVRARGVSTDSLGRFRLSLPPANGSTVRTRPTYLRVRRVGAKEVRVFLPSDFGYVVEVQLASAGFHVDHLATVRIKSPGFCAHAT